DTFHADYDLTASTTINDNNTVAYKAGETITLKAGFSYKPNNGKSFLARVEPCNDKVAFGFEHVTNVTDYGYNVNGNMITDPDKGITIKYNHLNLPYEVDFGGGKLIKWLYNADGMKMQKVVEQGNAAILKQDYVGELEYQEEQLEAVYHSEGRAVRRQNGSFEYQYKLLDHLGNARVHFSDIDNDGTADIIQENHYYPYGAKIEALSQTNSGTPNAYQFNGYNEKGEDTKLGMELITDFELNVHTAKYRTYDPYTVTFWQTDPKAELFYNLSPYNAMMNNPIRYNDPEGDCPDCIWDAINIGIGVKSFVDNVQQGNYGAAIVDGIGVVIDGAAAAVPFVPGGAGTVIKTARGADKAVDAIKGADKAVDAAKGVDKATDAGKGSNIDYVTTPDGTTVSTNQSKMRGGFDKAGFPSKEATKTAEPGQIHTVPTKHGDVDVRTMEGSNKHPRRAVFTESGTNNPVKVGGDKFRKNEPKAERRAQSHLKQDG
ncbi:MAG: 3-coathanger stack domain-containing protein, partial [Bacteroidota bacterium]